MTDRPLGLCPLSSRSATTSETAEEAAISAGAVLNRRVAVCAAAVAVSALGAQPASASTPVTGLNWVLALNAPLQSRLIGNCTSIAGLGWGYGGFAKGRQLYGTPPSFDLAAGSFDLTARGGAVAGRGDALIFDSFYSSQGSGGRPFKLSAVGIEMSAGRAYVTAQVRPTKTRFSAARRERVAVIAHPRLFSGPAHQTVKGKPVANSFLISVQGQATIMRPLATALGRARCTSSRFAAQGNGPVRVGSSLGLVTVQLLTQGAVGLAGTVEFSDGPSFATEDGSPVAVTATGGATVVTRKTETSLRFQLPAGTRTPLACTYGYKCVPASGGLSPVGGFALSYGGRSAAVGDMAITYEPSARYGSAIPTVTGTMNGEAVTISTHDEGVTQDFLARVGTALGVTVRGDELTIDPQFTSTTGL